MLFNWGRLVMMSLYRSTWVRLWFRLEWIIWRSDSSDDWVLLFLCCLSELNSCRDLRTCLSGHYHARVERCSSSLSVLQKSWINESFVCHQHTCTNQQRVLCSCCLGVQILVVFAADKHCSDSSRLWLIKCPCLKLSVCSVFSVVHRWQLFVSLDAEAPRGVTSVETL